MSEYILQMGYYPDVFWDKGRGPDVFFIHIDMDEEALRIGQTVDNLLDHTLHREVFLDAAEACLSTARRKFPQLDTADCFWSCLPKPEVTP